MEDLFWDLLAKIGYLFTGVILFVMAIIGLFAIFSAISEKKDHNKEKEEILK